MKSASLKDQEARFREALRAVPVRNASVKAEPFPSDPTRLRVEVQLRYDGFFQKIFATMFAPRRTKVYALDAVGSAFYQSIDGKKNLEQLIDAFAEREKLTFFEARAFVGQYLQTLTKKGLVVATLPK